MRSLAVSMVRNWRIRVLLFVVGGEVAATKWQQNQQDQDATSTSKCWDSEPRLGAAARAASRQAGPVSAVDIAGRGWPDQTGQIHWGSHDTSDSAKRARDAANQEGAAPHDVRLEAAVEGVAGQPLWAATLSHLQQAGTPPPRLQCPLSVCCPLPTTPPSHPSPARLDSTANRPRRVRTRPSISPAPNAQPVVGAAPERDERRRISAAFPRKSHTDKRRCGSRH